MSMSTCVVGVRDLKADFAKMMAVKLACEMAGTGYPAEVKAYFGSDVRQSEELLQQKMEKLEIPVHESSHDSTNQLEVVLSEIPKDVKAIRFSNSW